MIELSPRERIVLRSVIHNYILNANPVGSRNISKQYNLGLSPATIRNTMADLEELGLIEQPYTSAGRQPTNLGYRVYVDDLMEEKYLTSIERKLIDGSVQDYTTNVNVIMERTSSLLGRMSSLLGVVLSPKFDKGILHKIDVHKIAPDRLLVVLTIKSGVVKTVSMEINFDLDEKEITQTTAVLNQRLSGLTMEEIKQQISERTCELPPDSHRDLITLFADNANHFFDFGEDRQFYLTGLKTLVNQPEFSQGENLRTIIELMEDKKVLIHLIGDANPEQGLKVTIGDENLIETPLGISVITSAFYIGDNAGRIGVIGPTRMDYSKVVQVVDYTAKAVDKLFK